MQTLISTFARRVGRGLRNNQKRLIEEFLPSIQFDESECSKFDKISLEIGFGNGEFLLNSARNAPETLHIGCEPYLNGVASLLNHVENEDIKNIRVFADDVRILLAKMPANLLDQIYVICPDPWPKKRYHKRRIVQAEFIKNLESKLKEGGKMTFVTDHFGYAQWMLDEIKKCYSNYKAAKLEDFKDLPADWLYTKYQRRGIGLGSDIYCFELKSPLFA